MADLHPEAIRLAEACIKNFWSADHEIRWGSIEQEYACWLDPNTVLIGRVDADGVTADGERFFADWKTASKNKLRYMETTKAQWRMSPQALTYGLFLGGLTRRFLVRWALKTEPATCDYEWYTYSQEELDVWSRQLITIAEDIRTSRQRTTPWELNFTNCSRYGEKYACPFRNDGCWVQKFDHVPYSMSPRLHSHVALEDTIRAEHASNSNLVVLGSTRINDWLECHEKYRRLWEADGLTEEGEALTIGTDFHSIIAAHLMVIKKQQEFEDKEHSYDLPEA